MLNRCGFWGKKGHFCGEIITFGWWMITFEGPQCMWTNSSQKSRQGSDPPPFRQCLHFGIIWTGNPSLRLQNWLVFKKPFRNNNFFFFLKKRLKKSWSLMTWLIRTAVAGPIDCGTRPKQVGCRPQFILNVLLPEIQIDLFTKIKGNRYQKSGGKPKLRPDKQCDWNCGAGEKPIKCAEVG